MKPSWVNSGHLSAKNLTSVGCGAHVDHATNTVLAFVFGKRKDVVFKELKALLDPFGISRYDTDDWGAYERDLDAEKHEIGKRNTQKIECKNLNFRTWIKLLT